MGLKRLWDITCVWFIIVQFISGHGRGSEEDIGGNVDDKKCLKFL